MSYSESVQRYFRAPVNAGVLQSDADEVRRGEAGSPERGTWIVFHARVRADRIVVMKFQALACPHLIAACSRTTELLVGGTLDAARNFDPASLMADLDIPRHKRGRMLILEDALRNCFAAWDTTQLAGA